MTRLVMTTDSVGGVWTYALELIDALAPHDVEVTLAIMGPPPDARQLRELASSKVHAVHELHGALEWMEEPWDDVDAAGEELLALADAVGADLVHLNGFVHASLPWERPVVVVAHSDVMSWWHHVRGDEVPESWTTYRARVGDGLHAASAVVTLTGSGGCDLARAYGVGPTVCIPNGRRAHWVRDLPKEPIVLGAGRLWDGAKNLQALELAAPGIDWPVVLAGDPPPARTAGRCGTADGGMTLLGRLPFDELAGWMGRAGIFVAPARYEPFGLGALEAALSGCALVLGDIASVREVWGDAALYVDPDDPAALHAALQSLCRDPARCAALGSAARERAGWFTPQRMAAAYASLYATLLDPVSGDR